jgi:hypothetical protein
MDIKSHIETPYSALKYKHKYLENNQTHPPPPPGSSPASFMFCSAFCTNWSTDTSSSSHTSTFPHYTKPSLVNELFVGAQ